MDPEVEGFSQPEIIPQTHQIACAAIGFRIIICSAVIFVYQSGKTGADLEKKALGPRIIRKGGKIVVDLVRFRFGADIGIHLLPDGGHIESQMQLRIENGPDPEVQGYFIPDIYIGPVIIIIVQSLALDLERTGTEAEPDIPRRFLLFFRRGGRKEEIGVVYRVRPRYRFARGPRPNSGRLL